MKALFTGILLAVSLSGLAATQLTVVNHSKYFVEVGGMVNARASTVLLQPRKGSAVIKLQANAVAHLMLMKASATSYANNILLRSNAGRVVALALYHHIAMTYKNKHLVLG